MMGILYPARRLPEHHEGMLLVHFRDSVHSRMDDLVAGRSLENAPGLAALASHERAGRIERVVHLHPERGRVAPLGSAERPLATLASMGRGPAADAYSRVAAVHLTSGTRLTSVHRALENDPHVASVSRVPARYLLATAAARKSKPPVTSAPLPALRLWNLERIGWHKAQALPGFKTAGSVRVAVLDSGVQTDHPDLGTCVHQYIYRHPDHLPDLSENDTVGHGTHVTGILAAGGTDELGITGVSGCGVNVWKIFPDEPDYIKAYQVFVYAVDPILYRRALKDVVDQKPDVVNLSVGGVGKPDDHELALYRDMQDNGVVVVAAMGNTRKMGSPTMYPAAIPGVIAVGATDAEDNVAAFSSAGPHISLCAPGVSIWSTLPTYTGEMGYMAQLDGSGEAVRGKPLSRNTAADGWPGTSMAAPQVVGAIALLIANHGEMSPEQVRKRLMDTADKVPGMQGQPFTEDYGAGRLNLYNLLKS